MPSLNEHLNATNAQHVVKTKGVMSLQTLQTALNHTTLDHNEKGRENGLSRLDEALQLRTGCSRGDFECLRHETGSLEEKKKKPCVERLTTVQVRTRH